MVSIKQLYRYYAGGGKEPYDPNQHFLHAAQLLLALSATQSPNQKGELELPDGFDAVVEKRCVIEDVREQNCPVCPKDVCLWCVQTYEEKKKIGDEPLQAYFSCIGRKEFALGPEERIKGSAVQWWQLILGFSLLLFCCCGLVCYRFCVDFCEICSNCNPFGRTSSKTTASDYPSEARHVPSSRPLSRDHETLITRNSANLYETTTRNDYLSPKHCPGTVTIVSACRHQHAISHPSPPPTYKEALDADEVPPDIL